MQPWNIEVTVKFSTTKYLILCIHPEIWLIWFIHSVNQRTPSSNQSTQSNQSIKTVVKTSASPYSFPVYIFMCTSSLSGYEIRSEPNWPSCPPGTEIPGTGTECNEAAKFFGFPGGLPGCFGNSRPCTCLHYTPGYRGWFPHYNVLLKSVHIYPRLRKYFKSVCRKCWILLKAFPYIWCNKSILNKCIRYESRKNLG